MSFLTTTQRTEVESMIARYESAVAAGKPISDARVHQMYAGAKHVIEADNNGGSNTAFHSMSAKEIVTSFAAMVAMQDAPAEQMDPRQ